jgi:hypothetical protein
MVIILVVVLACHSSFSTRYDAGEAVYCRHSVRSAATTPVITVYCLHSKAQSAVVVAGHSLRSLTPLLTTVQTPDEDCHGFIRRPGLHFPISGFRLTTAATLEHI